MKQLKLFNGFFLFMLVFLIIGCYDEEKLGENRDPRCRVTYSVIYTNTSQTDIYMGSNSQPSASDVVKPGNTRTENSVITILTGTGYEEEYPVEMHIRSLDGLYYNYKSYSILPKDWSITPDPDDPTNLSNSVLTLRINCIYDGSNVTVNATQL